MADQRLAGQRLKDDWLALEKYRLEVIEDWPEGPKKEAARKAILSRIGSHHCPPQGRPQGSSAADRSGMIPRPVPPLA